MSKAAELIKRLFCRHIYAFHRNIYGDEIIACGWNRSVWKCVNCGRYTYRKQLHKESSNG